VRRARRDGDAKATGGLLAPIEREADGSACDSASRALSSSAQGTRESDSELRDEVDKLRTETSRELSLQLKRLDSKGYMPEKTPEPSPAGAPGEHPKGWDFASVSISRGAIAERRTLRAEVETVGLRGECFHPEARGKVSVLAALMRWWDPRPRLAADASPPGCSRVAGHIGTGDTGRAMPPVTVAEHLQSVQHRHRSYAGLHYGAGHA